MRHLITAILLAGTLSVCQGAQPATLPADWLVQVPALRTGDDRSFQCVIDLDYSTQSLRAYVSWVPPDRRCLIIVDRWDGLPLFIAADGRVWFYDIAAGAILRVRAEPDLQARASGDSVISVYGMRADFPDELSRITLHIDFSGMMFKFASFSPESMVVSDQPGTATYTRPHARARLEVDPKTLDAVSFEKQQMGPLGWSRWGIHSISRGGPLPMWHRRIDENRLPKALQVLPVSDRAWMSPEEQRKLDRSQRVLADGKLFAPRIALRDPELAEVLAAGPRFRLDINELRANEEKMRELWRAALREQGYDLPVPPPATTQPAENAPAPPIANPETDL